MKRLIYFFITLLIVLAFMGCPQPDNTDTKSKTETKYVYPEKDPTDDPLTLFDANPLFICKAIQRYNDLDEPYPPDSGGIRSVENVEYNEENGVLSYNMYQEFEPYWENYEQPKYIEYDLSEYTGGKKAIIIIELSLLEYSFSGEKIVHLCGDFSWTGDDNIGEYPNHIGFWAGNLREVYSYTIYTNNEGHFWFRSYLCDLSYSNNIYAIFKIEIIDYTIID